MSAISAPQSPSPIRSDADESKRRLRAGKEQISGDIRKEATQSGIFYSPVRYSSGR